MHNDNETMIFEIKNTKKATGSDFSSLKDSVSKSTNDNEIFSKARS